MPQEEKLLTTGQFARAARTTKETLFHYDRIGLFHPVKVGGKRLSVLLPAAIRRVRGYSEFTAHEHGAG